MGLLRGGPGCPGNRCRRGRVGCRARRPRFDRGACPACRPSRGPIGGPSPRNPNESDRIGPNPSVARAPWHTQKPSKTGRPVGARVSLSRARATLLERGVGHLQVVEGGHAEGDGPGRSDMGESERLERNRCTLAGGARSSPGFRATEGSCPRPSDACTVKKAGVEQPPARPATAPQTGSSSRLWIISRSKGKRRAS
jgi:hypothetical protein